MMGLIEKIHGKNLNFLIGSGASVGSIPTLATDWIDTRGDGRKLTIEELLLLCKEEKSPEFDNLQDLIYYYYYCKILKKSFLENLEENDKAVLENYKKLLERILIFLQRESYQKPNRANIFTTNYDLFFERAADEISGKFEFFFNDGSSGNIRKKLSMKNYHKKIIHTGIFDNFDREIPVINIFKAHGSVSWKYDSESSEIDVVYSNSLSAEFDEDIEIECINEDLLKKSVPSILGYREKLREKFVLIFPEKDKFEKTLFEEYYYQNLRQLSYELEKEQSVLIVFGFSFADEHIAEMVKRSLNNPTLKVYIFCYDERSKDYIKEKLKIELLDKINNKVEFIIPKDEGTIDFSRFLEKLFGSDEDE